MSVGTDYGYFLYTMDDGTTQFNVRIAKTLGNNADAGFAAFDATKPVRRLYSKRLGVSCRHALLLSSTTGNRRKVPLGTVACDLWTGVASTISFVIKGSATPETFAITHRVGEANSPAHATYNL